MGMIRRLPRTRGGKSAYPLAPYCARRAPLAPPPRLLLLRFNEPLAAADTHPAPIAEATQSARTPAIIELDPWHWPH